MSPCLLKKIRGLQLVSLFPLRIYFTRFWKSKIAEPKERFEYSRASNSRELVGWWWSKRKVFLENANFFGTKSSFLTATKRWSKRLMQMLLHFNLNNTKINIKFYVMDISIPLLVGYNSRFPSPKKLVLSGMRSDSRTRLGRHFLHWTLGN